MERTKRIEWVDMDSSKILQMKLNALNIACRLAE